MRGEGIGDDGEDGVEDDDEELRQKVEKPQGTTRREMDHSVT